MVTGGGSGIGEACAMRLGREGAGVAVVDISAAGAEGWPPRTAEPTQAGILYKSDSSSSY